MIDHDIIAIWENGNQALNSGIISLGISANNLDINRQRLSELIDEIQKEASLCCKTTEYNPESMDMLTSAWLNYLSAYKCFLELIRTFRNRINEINFSLPITLQELCKSIVNSSLSAWDGVLVILRNCSDHHLIPVTELHVQAQLSYKGAIAYIYSLNPTLSCKEMIAEAGKFLDSNQSKTMIFQCTGPGKREQRYSSQVAVNISGQNFRGKENIDKRLLRNGNLHIEELLWRHWAEIEDYANQIREWRVLSRITIEDYLMQVFCQALTSII